MVAAQSTFLANIHTDGSVFRGKEDLDTSGKRLKFGGMQLGLVSLRPFKDSREKLSPPEVPSGVQLKLGALKHFLEHPFFSSGCRWSLRSSAYSLGHPNLEEDSRQHKHPMEDITQSVSRVTRQFMAGFRDSLGPLPQCVYVTDSILCKVLLAEMAGHLVGTNWRKEQSPHRDECPHSAGEQ